MDINVSTAHTSAAVVTSDGSLLPPGSVLTIGNLPLISGEAVTSLANGTTIINLPIIRDGTIINATAIPTSQGLVIATGPDASSAVLLDPSQVAMLAQTATHTVDFAPGESADLAENGQMSAPAQPVSQAQHGTTSASQDENMDIRPPVGKGPFKCEMCDKLFVKWSQLQRHLRSHADDKPHRCDQCSMSFNVSTNLMLHQATHVLDDPTCPECGKRFNRVASLKAHIMLHQKEENLMCSECGDEFSTQGQLDKHMHEHREEGTECRIYSCRQCTQEFTRASLLREHMKAHYKIKASLSHRTYKRNIDRSGFLHKCNTCGKHFKKPSQLDRHNRIHTGERPYKCDQCDKAFNQKGALQIHMTKHSGERPYPCNFCPSAFSQKGNLRAHIQRVHPITQEGAQRMFRCDECSCVFRKLGSLNAHVSRMHTEEGDGQAVSHNDDLDNEPSEGRRNVNSVIQQLLDLSGRICDNNEVPISGSQPTKEQLPNDPNVASADLLQQALENSGLADGAKNLPAGHGGTVSAQNVSKGEKGTANLTRSKTPSSSHNVILAESGSGTLRRHVIRKVGGVRWHQCLYCSKEFKKPSDLVRHIRIHTHEKPYKCMQCFRSFAVKSTLTAHVRTHLGLKEYPCQVCEKMFSTPGSLRVHLRLHTGAKPFECPHCDKSFRTSGHRKSHIQSHLKSGEPRRVRRAAKRQTRSELTLPDITLQEPILITDLGLIQQAPKYGSSTYSQFLNETSNADRPYRCDYCSRGFKKSSHLKQHVRSHTGEKPYRCPQCLRYFVSGGVLKIVACKSSGASVQ